MSKYWNELLRHWRSGYHSMTILRGICWRMTITQTGKETRQIRCWLKSECAKNYWWWLYTDCSSAHLTCLHNHRHRRNTNMLECSGRSGTETDRHGTLRSHIENTRVPITLLSFAAVLLRVEGSWNSLLEIRESISTLWGTDGWFRKQLEEDTMLAFFWNNTILNSKTIT